MEKSKVRVIGVLLTLTIIAMAIMPGTVQANDPGCRFHGSIAMSDRSPVPGTDLKVQVKIPGAAAGPWTAIPNYENGVWGYFIDVPWDDPATAIIEGGTDGALVEFSLYVDGLKVIIGNNIGIFKQAGMEENTTKSLTISTPIAILGDANSDGYLSIADIIIIELYMAGIPGVILGPGADANQDGDINIADIIKIELMMSGIDP